MASEPAASDSLFSRLKPLIVILWIIAAVRLAYDFREVDADIVGQTGFIQWTADWISVNYLVVPLLLVFGVRGMFRGMSWVRCLKAIALLAVLCWAIPNAIAYTTGQLKGWQHGRYRGQGVAMVDGKQVTFDDPDHPPEGATDIRNARTAPLGNTTGEKIQAGVIVGGATAIAGFIWLFLWFHVLVYLPRRFGANV